MVNTSIICLDHAGFYGNCATGLDLMLDVRHSRNFMHSYLAKFPDHLNLELVSKRKSAKKYIRIVG